MLIFKSTNPNADVMYTLWRFDLQGWVDQCQEESMMPHIYASLQGYLGRWVHSLEDGGNITILELLAHMNRAFGDVRDYDTMKRSLYENRQKEKHAHPQKYGVAHIYYFLLKTTKLTQAKFEIFNEKPFHYGDKSSSHARY